MLVAIMKYIYNCIYSCTKTVVAKFRRYNFTGTVLECNILVFVSGVGLPYENGRSFVLGRCVFHKIG